MFPIPFRSSHLLLCVALFISLSRSVFATSQRPSEISKYAYEDLRTCHFAEDSCRTCWDECPAFRHPFFGSTRDTDLHEDLVLSLQECLRETTYYRQWLPDWCINDRSGFYATEDFTATQENCLMQPFACSQHLESTARELYKQKKLSSSSGRFILFVKLGELGRAQKTLENEVNAFEDRKKKISRIKEAWDKRWYEEADFHVKNPEETTTKYADPVFRNYSTILKENQVLDIEISRNDLISASVENKFVRRDTVEKIPSILKSISTLKNQIHSKKSQTDKYLQEIKDIATKTAELQEKATNIIYETTHSKELDGEIVLLDKQLLDLYIELKKERSRLRELNVRATFSKLRLVGVMRMTIQQISRKQLHEGCNSSEVMGF